MEGKISGHIIQEIHHQQEKGQDPMKTERQCSETLNKIEIMNISQEITQENLIMKGINTITTNTRITNQCKIIIGIRTIRIEEAKTTTTKIKEDIIRAKNKWRFATTSLWDQK